MITVESGKVQVHGNPSLLISELSSAILAVKREFMKEVDERVANNRIEISYRNARDHDDRKAWEQIMKK